MWRVVLSAAVLVTGCKGEETDEPVGGLDYVQDMTVPSKRSEILAAAHEASNQIMIFGGNEGPIVNQIPTAVFRNDTWIFEPGVGWTEVATDTQPKKRGRYSMVVDQAGERALLFGGRFRREGESGNYELFNDLWEFSFVDRSWNRITEGDANGPTPRYYPAGAWDEETRTMYIWGGNLNRDPLSFQKAEDLWMWKDGLWAQIPTSGQAPNPSRAFFGSMWDPTRKRIVVFGGQIGNFQDQAFNALYALDVTTGEWSELNQGSGSVFNDGGSPSTRMHAHMTYDDLRDRYLVWGGHTDIGDQNDLWAFNPTVDEWEEIHMADVLTGSGVGCGGNPSEVPKRFVEEDTTAPERRHRGMFALMHDSLWISQGIHAECSNQVDDTWRYDIEGDEWIELIPATSGESCARRGDACDCLCI